MNPLLAKYAPELVHSTSTAHAHANSEPASWSDEQFIFNSRQPKMFNESDYNANDHSAVGHE